MQVQSRLQKSSASFQSAVRRAADKSRKVAAEGSPAPTSPSTLPILEDLAEGTGGGHVRSVIRNLEGRRGAVAWTGHVQVVTSLLLLSAFKLLHILKFRFILQSIFPFFPFHYISLPSESIFPFIYFIHYKFISFSFTFSFLIIPLFWARWPG